MKMIPRIPYSKKWLQLHLRHILIRDLLSVGCLTLSEQKGERRVLLKKEAELPYIIVAYHTPNFPHDDSYALDILSLILSGGKSTRLYKSLVYEKKIALYADSEYDGFI